MLCEFIYNERLGISLPELRVEWVELPEAEQEAVLERWERVRGSIPDKIKELEAVIMEKQRMLSAEENFQASCRLNSEIAELASRINDLHLWYRIDQSMEEGKLHR